MKSLKTICKVIYIVLLVKIVGLVFMPSINHIESTYYSNINNTSAPNKSHLPLFDEYFLISRFTESAVINKLSCETFLLNLNSYSKQIFHFSGHHNIINVRIQLVLLLTLLSFIPALLKGILVDWVQKKDGKKRLLSVN